MNLLLQHTPQPQPWGSLYYALYSLVGNERILADLTEANPNCFNSLMAEPGYHLHPLWVDQTSSCTTTLAWWAKALNWDATDYCAGDAVGIMPLLLHLPTHLALLCWASQAYQLLSLTLPSPHSKNLRRWPTSVPRLTGGASW
jgi:hypothetical protein